jgi:hypothetical protein
MLCLPASHQDQDANCIQILHQISVILHIMDDSSSSSSSSDGASAQRGALPVKKVEKTLSSCCTELLKRWKSFHGDCQDLNKAGSWTRQDLDSNNFMDRLVTTRSVPVVHHDDADADADVHDEQKRQLTRRPQTAGGILEIIFSIWKNQKNHHHHHRLTQAVPLWRSDVQQCCCIIVMLLAWDSKPRASAIVTRGGISCLLDVMETFVGTEGNQIACLAGMIHLMQMSSKRILVHALSQPSTITPNRATTESTRPGGHKDEDDTISTKNKNKNKTKRHLDTLPPAHPEALRLLTRVERAMSTFPWSPRIYQYSCAVLLTGFQRDCFPHCQNEPPSSSYSRCFRRCPRLARTAPPSSSPTPTMLSIHVTHKMIRSLGRVTSAVYQGLIVLLVGNDPEDSQSRNVACLLLVEILGADLAKTLVDHAERAQCHGAAA